jgi:hypothetical protein
MADDGFQVPPGSLYVTTYGSVRPETTQSLLAMQARAHSLGLNNIDFRITIGTLVDKARNEAVKELLSSEPRREYLWFLDGDMAVQPEIIGVMLKTAYDECKEFDIIGAYCQLRGEPYLPTIDTGTGTWEPQQASQGPLEVMRTGGACILIKRHVFEAMEYPWYGIRPAPRPIDMMAEVDNYARIKFDGRNPFWGKEWEQLLGCAQADVLAGRREVPNASLITTTNTVGEDSAFTDKAKALGFRIAVQTNAICGHVDKRILWPQDHVDAMKKVKASEEKACGILE